MAIINLGTRAMIIGALPVTFNTFDFEEKTSRLIQVVFSISAPSNLFSYITLRGIITNDVFTDVYMPYFTEVDILQREQTILLPFLSILDSEGTCTLEAERISRIPGAAEINTLVTMSLSFDDDLEEKL